MVFRLIVRYLANNEKLIQRLSESYPIRRAAQLTINVWYRGKQLTEDSNLKNVTAIDWKSLIQRIARNVREEIQQAKNDLHNKRKQ